MSQRYDICIITTIHQDFDNRIYQRQACALMDAGYKVCIVAPWDFTCRDRNDFSYVRTPYPARRKDRIVHGWKTFKAALGVDAHLYIFHDNDFLPWSLLLKRKTGRAVVYDAHENIPEDILYGKDWIPAAMRWPLSFIFRGVENFVVSRLGETMVAVTNLERRFRGVGARAVLVRNFANFNVAPDFHNEMGVLYTGDLTRDYGVENLLSLARSLKRRGIMVPFRIVDRFREDEVMRRYVRHVIDTEGLNIDILDPVPAQRMPEILAKGSIGLSPIPNLPNKALALPTKIFEYFAFGLVALASDIEGTREAMDDGRLGYLLPDNDIEAWADAIQEILENPAKAEHYRQLGREASRTLFSYPQEKERMLTYVAELLAR